MAPMSHSQAGPWRSAPVTNGRLRVRVRRAAGSRSTYWLNAPAAAEATSTASTRTREAPVPGPDPDSTTMPAAAAKAMATPILSLKRLRTCFTSAQRPDRRQVLPVDEVVQDEGHQEHHRQHEGARRHHA